jgi:hypothetical protein
VSKCCFKPPHLAILPRQWEFIQVCVGNYVGYEVVHSYRSSCTLALLWKFQSLTLITLVRGVASPLCNMILVNGIFIQHKLCFSEGMRSRLCFIVGLKRKQRIMDARE